MTHHDFTETIFGEERQPPIRAGRDLHRHRHRRPVQAEPALARPLLAVVLIGGAATRRGRPCSPWSPGLFGQSSRPRTSRAPVRGEVQVV